MYSRGLHGSGKPDRVVGSLRPKSGQRTRFTEDRARLGSGYVTVGLGQLGNDFPWVTTGLG